MAVVAGLLNLSGPVVDASAASIFVSPSGTWLEDENAILQFDLFADFTGTPTIGGGIDVSLSGPLQLAGFDPSPWLETVPDPDLSGFSTAGNVLSVYFGEFLGVSGLNPLGSIVVMATGLGIGAIDVSFSEFWGPFYDTQGAPLPVEFRGAEVVVEAQDIPIPPAALGLLAIMLSWIGSRHRAGSG